MVHRYVQPWCVLTRAILSNSLCRMLQRKFFLRANKVEVKPKGEDSKEAPPREKKAGKEGEGRRKKVTDSPRAKKQQVLNYDVIMISL